MNKSRHKDRQHRCYTCHTHRAEKPLFLLVFCSNVGLQIFCSGNRPCVRVPHPVAIDQKAVNVGGLPDYVDFKEIVEPLRDLFKDEVRRRAAGS